MCSHRNLISRSVYVAGLTLNEALYKYGESPKGLYARGRVVVIRRYTLPGGLWKSF